MSLTVDPLSQQQAIYLDARDQEQADSEDKAQFSKPVLIAALSVQVITIGICLLVTTAVVVWAVRTIKSKTKK